MGNRVVPMVVGLAVLAGGYAFVTRNEAGGSSLVHVVNAPAMALAGAQLDDIKRQAAADACAQYQIAKRSGDRADACAHASLAAETFLQAKDEAGYGKWKAVAAADCQP